MFQVLYFASHWLTPFLVPICFVLAWGLTIAAFLGVFSAVREAIVKSQKMHAIPCTNCRFFTNDHRLKCTIQPFIANTEQAIQCPEFQTKSHSFYSSYLDN
ncbi:hypothetical protein [Spirulina sp. 06S082]|uniref:hypothetical protein n=1 Tax=Spirulina sp. 06S082 TaxID=3110248 RepID=UPI002B21CB08|nr:hypothetical protein [Spirulina sp. 06S082]MEA5470851.1 hypothetical protein [Spirulina sp. 06S082]